MIDYLQSQKQEMIHLLETIVNIDSNSYDKDGVDQVGALLKDKFEEIGMHVKVHRQAEQGNHLEIKAERESEPKILIVAHMDTVFPKGEAEKRPFSIIGDKAYGPGVNDEKASHVQVLYAMKALKESGSPAISNVHIIFNSDEEIGSVSSKALIEEAAAEKDYSLIVECGRPNDGVVTSRKGVGHFTMNVQGKSAHSGVEPEIGVSAIEELSHKVIRLQKLNDYDHGLTVNVGLIKGGTSVNTVPPHAEAEIDVRIKNKDQGMNVTKSINEIASEETVEGTRTELTGSISRPPMERTEGTGKLFQTIQETGKELGFSIHEVSTGGGSDAAFTASKGIPTIDGMGPIGEFSHSETEEYTDLNSLVDRTLLLAKTIERLSE
ncbi:M20 family metallopeptidase [Bacillus badius]|uniref:Acetylornithine deacetylase/Succinyl-diaminopimelate desuccinylase n=1 Tax=Bacillus badius TaxID=1455 RepID=A0ABR5AQV1_BACBA|nr:M20 family metallopeptidase [Bacillus badius]KIL72625.1 Acetylornithine deacetylase [Bacillus badius]KIL77123.1 Acetylornithine deacetylase/Succinyl-diaminopimelate desuccinylase [Bacillus badius]KZR59456.1 carboxypeptidase [Bacillus badius]MED4716711.1 M20 family metallopeptidase [Bacillus badius]